MGKDIVFLVRLVTVEARIVAVKCLGGIYRRAVGPNASPLSERITQRNEDPMWELACLRWP